MSRAKKLTPKLVEASLAKNAAGWSQARIAKWLGTAHGVKVTQQSISEAMRKVTAERAKVSRPLVEAHLADAVPADLRRIENDLRRMDRVVREARRKHQPTVEIRATEQRRKLIETRLRLSGGDRSAAEEFIDNVVDLAGLALAEEDDAARRAAISQFDIKEEPLEWLRARLLEVLPALEKRASAIFNKARALLGELEAALEDEERTGAIGAPMG